MFDFSHADKKAHAGSEDWVRAAMSNPEAVIFKGDCIGERSLYQKKAFGERMTIRAVHLHGVSGVLIEGNGLECSAYVVERASDIKKLLKYLQGQAKNVRRVK